MSSFYYQKQRKEDIASLEAMFGPPWTDELMGKVLDHYAGNVDEAVEKLLILESLHNGNPGPLVEKLVMSGIQRKFGGTKVSIPSSNATATMVAIPKSKMKKPPPARQVKIDVTTADGSQSTTITIKKNTRRRIGTPIKLPNDFLRIPKQRKEKKKPLFNPNTLDQLTDMPSPKYLSRGAKAAPGTAAKFQSFMNSFTKPESAMCTDNTKRRFRRTKSQDSAGSGTASNLMSKFIVPKLTAPTISMPKIQLPTLAASPAREQAPAQPQPKTPPMEMFRHYSGTSSTPQDLFTKPNEDGRWGISMPAFGAKTMPKEESAPNKPATNRWNLSGTGSGGNTGRRWSLPEMTMANKTTPDATFQTGEGSQRQSGSNRWSLSFTKPGTGFADGEEPALEQAPARNAKPWTGSRWSVTSSASHSPTIAPTVDSAASKDDDGDTYGCIPQVEFRGVSVKQLKQLAENMQQRCVAEQWRSVETGQPLEASQVSMYELVAHYVCPQTRDRSCSYVEQAFGKHHYEHGLTRPPKWFVSHTWSDSVMDLVQCIDQHAADRGHATSDEANYWVCAFAINQHAVGANVVADLDRLSDDSLLQDPRLTQKVLQVTEGMLAVIDRKDVFFSRIWCLWELFLALERAKTSVDVNVTGELDDQYLVDVYAISEEGTSVGLTSGVPDIDKYRASKLAEGSKCSSGGPTTGLLKSQPINQLEWSEHRAVRQSLFRFQSCQVALEVNLESTHASLERDTRKIMNCIVQNKSDDNPNEAEALTEHPASAHVNGLIRGTFAGMAYRRALEDSVGEKKDRFDRLSLKKVQSTLLASPLSSLEVSFAGCPSFQIREALKFVESLPTSLRRLDLDYSFLEFQYAEEFAIGLSRLSENLQIFRLNLAFCTRVDNLDRLWEELGNLVNLRSLVLVIQPTKALTSVDGLTASLSKMPHLECLQLEFDCFGEYSKMFAMAKGGEMMNNISRNMLGKSSGSPDPMQELPQPFNKVAKLSNMDLSGAYISDSTIRRLCRSIASRPHESRLKCLKLRFLGDFGKKLKGVENAEDLQKALQRIRSGLKLFS